MVIDEKKIEEIYLTFLKVSEKNRLNVILEMESFFDSEISDSVEYFKSRRVDFDEISKMKQLLLEIYRQVSKQVFVKLDTLDISYWIEIRSKLLKEICLDLYQFKNIYKIYRIGPKLKALCDKENISIELLVERTGMSKRIIQNIQKDGRNISVEKLLNFFNNGLLKEIPNNL